MHLEIFGQVTKLCQGTTVSQICTGVPNFQCVDVTFVTTGCGKIKDPTAQNTLLS